MKIVIVGCGRAGAELAYRLDRGGHQVTVIDEVAASFHNLRPEFRGRTIQGSVLTRETLQRAGLAEADGFAAVTNSDTVNAIAAHVARTVYRVSNVVVRNYSTGWLPLHEAFGYPLVSSTAWAAQRVEARLTQGQLRVASAAAGGDVEVYELRVPPAWHARALSELLPAAGCRAVALTRGGRAVLVTADAPLEAGDEVLLGATPAGLAELRARLDRPPGPPAQRGEEG